MIMVSDFVFNVFSVCTNVCVSSTSSLALFSVYFDLFWFVCFYFTLFIIIIIILDTCLYSNEREKERV